MNGYRRMSQARGWCGFGRGRSNRKRFPIYPTLRRADDDQDEHSEAIAAALGTFASSTNSEPPGGRPAIAERRKDCPILVYRANQIITNASRHRRARTATRAGMAGETNGCLRTSVAEVR